jgi:hypothetical protein
VLDVAVGNGNVTLAAARWRRRAGVREVTRYKSLV